MIEILIVDDSFFVRHQLREIIEKSNKYKLVGEAGSGREAIIKAKELKPDIITMDVSMADIDGLKATKEILKEDPEVLIIMLSAMGQKPIIKECLEEGAIDFIVKPFSKDDILDKIDEIAEIELDK